MGSMEVAGVSGTNTEPTALPLTPWRRPAIVLSVAACALIVIYWRTVAQLLRTWGSMSFSHCWLIAPMTAYLIWVKRDRLRSVECQPSLRALAGIPLAGAAWFAGFIGDVQVLQQYALVALFIMTAWALLGTHAMRTLHFPMAFLFLAVPIGESLIPPLQDITAMAATNLLNWTGIIAVLDGRSITVSNGAWQVAEACSGIRYMISSVTIAIFFAHIAFHSWRRRAAFVGAAIVVPILANCLRAYGIVALAYVTNNRLAAGVDHVVYGWIFFGVIMLILLVIGMSWREPVLGHEAPGLGAHRSPPNIASARLVVGVGAAAILLSALPLAAGRLAMSRLPQLALQTSFPAVQQPWMSVYSANADRWISDSIKPRARIAQVYGRAPGSSELKLFIGYYPISGDGVDLIHFGRSLLRKKGQPFQQRQQTAQVDGLPVRVQEIVTEPMSGEVIWMWFSVGNEFTINPYKVKLLQGRARLLRHPPASAVIAVSANYRLDATEARNLLQDFLSHTSLASAITTLR